jgi:branched-chain amino acid aminotransferase
VKRSWSNYTKSSQVQYSAQRMQMPEISEDTFIEGMRKLVELDKAWIPQRKDHSLYIRRSCFLPTT